jgi:hypothetical protein
VQQVVYVVTHMLENCNPHVLTRMVAAGCNIAIIGRDQVRVDTRGHISLFYTRGHALLLHMWAALVVRYL